MKIKEIQRFAQSCVLPSLEGYASARKIVFERPLSDVLRGFYFEDSEFNPRCVYVSVLVLPLYVPVDSVHFQFGKRLFRRVGFLRSREDWEIAAPYDRNICLSLLESIRSQGVPYLKKVGTPELIIKNLRWVTGLWDDPYVREAIAYSLARIGELNAAKRRLERLLRSIRSEEKYDELTGRGLTLLEAIRRGPDHTATLLNAWSRETARALKLPDEH